MALKKAEKQEYVEQENYLETELLKYVQDQNVKAWTVMIIWLFFNAVFGVLYLLDVMDNADLLMLTVLHPERFWRGSNKNLQCASCKDKICQIKGRV